MTTSSVTVKLLLLQFSQVQFTPTAKSHTRGLGYAHTARQMKLADHTHTHKYKRKHTHTSMYLQCIINSGQ